MTLELEVRAQMIYRRDRELPVLDSRKYLDTHWDFATPDWDAAHTRYMIVVRDGMPAGKVMLDAGGSARARGCAGDTCGRCGGRRWRGDYAGGQINTI